MSLPALLAASSVDDETLHAVIDANWLQGRTAYGGVSTALAFAAAKGLAGDLPPLRSAQIAFVGPLAGPVTAKPLLLRRGKNSAFVSVDVTSAEGTGLRALFLFMAPRASSIAHTDLPAPDWPLGEERVDPSQVPQGFLSNFEFAPWHAADGTIRRWVRLIDRAGLDGTTELVCVADALPPAAMSLAPQWGPISTTTWQLNLVTDAPATDEGWWLLEAETLYAGDGNSSQTMTIWNRKGSPVATATQSVALFL